MTTQKTAWSRFGEGRKGFGLLGAGAAQASAGTAFGFGYFGAAKRICDAFIAKGPNADLPLNTPIPLRFDSNDPAVARDPVADRGFYFVFECANGQDERGPNP
jgi:hypothetical protein